jgi:hypothetical protein
MKKILYTALLLCSVFTCTAADVLKLFKDANEVKSTPVRDSLIFYFGGDRLYVYEDDDNLLFEMPYESFSRMVFDLGLDGITDIKAAAADINVCYDPLMEEIRVKTEKSIKEVRVYNMQGMCMRNATHMDAESEVIVNMSGLSSGIYIVAVMGEDGVFTSKIAKK